MGASASLEPHSPAGHTPTVPSRLLCSTTAPCACPHSRHSPPLQALQSLAPLTGHPAPAAPTAPLPMANTSDSAPSSSPPLFAAQSRMRTVGGQPPEPPPPSRALHPFPPAAPRAAGAGDKAGQRHREGTASGDHWCSQTPGAATPPGRGARAVQETFDKHEIQLRFQ